MTPTAAGHLNTPPIDLAAQARATLTAPRMQALIHAAQDRTGPELRALYRELGRQGLLASHWPVEYGGRGMDRAVATAVYEELVHAGVPDTPHVLGIQIVGECLRRFASEDICRDRLPQLAGGKSMASVLYTEPGAGSDLGSLQTTAIPDGPHHYRLSGTKILNLYSHLADFALVAARVGELTANRYAGISLFVMNLDAEGVGIELLPTVQDEPFCRVRLRDVAVPREHLIGEEGMGWGLLDAALAVERTGIDHVARACVWLRPLAAELHASTADDDRLPVLGRLAMRTAVAALLSRHLATHDGEARISLVATAKCLASQVARDVAQATYIGTRRAEPATDSAMRDAPGLTLSAGTTEMMRELFLAQLRGGDVHELDARSSSIDPEVFDAAAACISRVLHERRRTVPDHRPDAEREDALWRALDVAGLTTLESSPGRGGLGLGLPAGVAICEALGAAGVEDAYATRIRASTGECLEDDTALRVRRTGYVVAMATELLREVWARAESRCQFGEILLDFQAVSHPFATEVMELTALRWYLHDLAARYPASGTEIEALGLRTLASERAVAAATTAVQITGSIGLTGATGVGARYTRLLDAVHGVPVQSVNPWRHVGAAASTQGEELFPWLRTTPRN